MQGSKLNKSQSKYYNTACLMNEALLFLLEKKDYEFITVKEICEKAGVNRSTFYLHYESMNDLLCETIEYVGNSVKGQFESHNVIDVKQISTCPLEDLVFITPKYLLPYLEFTKAQRKVFKTAYTQPNVLRVQNIADHLYKNIFEPVLIRFNVSQEERRYKLAFYLNGISAIIKEWVKNDCKEDVQKIADIIMACLKIKDILCENPRK